MINIINLKMANHKPPWGMLVGHFPNRSKQYPPPNHHLGDKGQCSSKLSCSFVLCSFSTKLLKCSCRLFAYSKFHLVEHLHSLQDFSSCTWPKLRSPGINTVNNTLFPLTVSFPNCSSKAIVEKMCCQRL